MSTLNLWPTAEAAEARYRAALTATGVLAAAELGVGHATAAELVAAADESGGARLGKLGERLLIDDLSERAGGPWQRIAHSRGLRRSLARIFAALQKTGVSPEQLAVAARAVDGGAREVARVYAEYRRRLGELSDDAESWRRGCARVAAGAPARMLDGVERVEVRGVVDWDGPRLMLLDALLERGLAVRVVLPSAERPQLQRALAPALAQLESRHGQVGLEAVREPLAPPERRPLFIAAATPFVEAREVARRARDLVDGGAAPESIVVVAESDARRALLVEALSRYGLPVSERRRAPAASAPPVRIALSLLDLAEERAERRLGRERLLALASSRYLAPGALPAHRLARVMREAGVVDLSAWQEPLAAWQSRHPESRAREAERAAARLDELLAVLSALPAQATLAEHCRALGAALERLELPARTRGFVSDGEGGTAETRALARDQAALRALDLLLQDLPRAAPRAGLQRASFTRRRFARILDEALAAEELRAGGVRGAAVEVTDLGALAERRPAHLFICGLVDGELPARPPEDTLLSDDERLRLNRLLGRAALPLSSGAEDRSALAFFLALAGPAGVTLTWTRTDEEGAPLLRSALLDELHLREPEIVSVARDPLPRVAEARTLDELTARVALEVRGDRGSRLSLPDREASTELYRLLAARAPARLARIDHLAATERLRERFFSGQVPEFPSVGALREGALLEALAPRLPGRLDAPLSASAVESYAACPFKFFLRSVLDAAPIEEVDEELDPLAAGRLHHRVLERIFRRLATEGRFPLTGDAAERELVRDACDEALADWRRSNPIGHPALFAVWERRLRRQIEALVESERQRPPAPGCTPARFESRFGPLAVRAPDSDEVIHLHGLIDRIDLGPGKAVVLDYKSGAKQRFAAQVKDEALCDSSWQLPIYAAAARAELGPEVTVEARFYSLRDVEVSGPVEGGDRVALDDLGRQRARAQGQTNLRDALWTVHRAMRGGDFTVRPREDACQRCGMEGACRVMRAVDEPEVVE